jgi:hypothetical protein
VIPSDAVRPPLLAIDAGDVEIVSRALAAAGLAPAATAPVAGAPGPAR